MWDSHKRFAWYIIFPIALTLLFILLAVATCPFVDSSGVIDLICNGSAVISTIMCFAALGLAILCFFSVIKFIKLMSSNYESEESSWLNVSNFNDSVSNVTVKPSVIDKIAEHITQSVEGVKKVCGVSTIEYDRGIRIELKLRIKENAGLTELCRMIQKKLMAEIPDIIGIKVESVCIQIVGVMFSGDNDTEQKSRVK